MKLNAVDCADFASRGKRVVVMLDGVRARYVTFADEEAGVLERIRTNANGNFVIKQDGSKDVERIVQWGRVEIRIESLH